MGKECAAIALFYHHDLDGVHYLEFFMEAHRQAGPGAARLGGACCPPHGPRARDALVAVRTI